MRTLHAAVEFGLFRVIIIACRCGEGFQCFCWQNKITKENKIFGDQSSDALINMIAFCLPEPHLLFVTPSCRIQEGTAVTVHKA